MATLLWPGNEFRISHQEMIKGMRIGGMGTALSYLDELVIPIIENTPQEEDLAASMEKVSFLRRVFRQEDMRKLTVSLRFRLCETILTPCATYFPTWFSILEFADCHPYAACCARSSTWDLFVGSWYVFTLQSPALQVEAVPSTFSRMS